MPIHQKGINHFPPKFLVLSTVSVVVHYPGYFRPERSGPKLASLNFAYRPPLAYLTVIDHNSYALVHMSRFIKQVFDGLDHLGKFRAGIFQHLLRFLPTTIVIVFPVSLKVSLEFFAFSPRNSLDVWPESPIPPSKPCFSLVIELVCPVRQIGQKRRF